MADVNDQTDVSCRSRSAGERLFTSQWIAPLAVAISLLFTVCSIHNGLEFDDYYHRAVLSGSTRFGDQLRGPQAMFRFLPGDPEHAQASMDAGLLPWWTDPEIKAEFFQLIPTQTHILDYWLWPDEPRLMHVHSLLWFALLVFLAAGFYRRILGPTWMAGVATLLFAIEDGHAVPVAWICNRNILIAASFGFGCLICHDAWRRDNRHWAFPLAVLFWALCLCSKEAGIATCAYLFAYAVWIDESALGRRFLTLLPYGLVLVVWRVVRDSLGYGVAHLGYYVDPISDPGRFVMAMLERYPIFLFGQWGGLSEISAIFDKLTGSLFWWMAVGYVTVVGLLCWPVLRRDRISRFFATGMLLAVIPICATFPMDRLLMFVGLGAFGLLVRFWNTVLATDGQEPRPAMWRIFARPTACLFVLLHVIAAPVLLMVRAAAPFGPPELVDTLYLDVHFDEAIETQDLVVVSSPPISLGLCHSLLNYEHDGAPVPRALRVLAPGIGSVTVKRTDAQTLEVEPQDGYLRFGDRLFRNEQHPFQTGETVTLDRMTATVLAIKDARPSSVAFRFATPLEDSSLRWLWYQAGEFVPWVPPAVGEQVSLEPNWKSRLPW